MSIHEAEERRHTRDDYHSGEDYLRYLHESGLEPYDRYGRPRADVTGPSPYPALVRAIYGTPPTRRAAAATTGLERKDLLKLYKAVALANLQGHVLDTFTTIAWSTLGYVQDRAVDVEHRHFMEVFRHWCDDNDIPCAAIWTKERGDKHGLHSHILACVPDHLQTAYRVWAKGALERRTGQALLRPIWNQATPKVSTLHISDPKGGRADWENQWEVFHYMTKGIYEAHLAKILKASHSSYLGVEFRKARIAAQGAVDGKRCGVTRNLDLAAQTAFDLDVGLPPLIWPASRLQPGDLRFDDAFIDHGNRLIARAKLFSSISILDV